MKVITTIGCVVLAACSYKSHAQKMGPLPVVPWTSQLKGFEKINPGATVLNRSSKGFVYNMPQDNMAVLLPYNVQQDQMPGSTPSYTPPPPANMPNPLYPPSKVNDKKRTE